MCTFVKKEVLDGTVGPSGGWGEGVAPSTGSEGNSPVWGTGLCGDNLNLQISLCLLSSVPWGRGGKHLSSSHCGGLETISKVTTKLALHFRLNPTSTATLSILCWELDGPRVASLTRAC